MLWHRHQIAKTKGLWIRLGFTRIRIRPLRIKKRIRILTRIWASWNTGFGSEEILKTWFGSEEILIQIRPYFETRSGCSFVMKTGPDLILKNVTRLRNPKSNLLNMLLTKIWPESRYCMNPNNGPPVSEDAVLHWKVLLSSLQSLQSLYFFFFFFK